jgi:hypothetical protein
MNFTIEPSSIMSGFANVVLLIVGILIKMELHDIKSRITRLEDIFIIPKGKD